uniref:Uncharacterized protein n=1 Tax=Parascaris equorum TaxID=6256 RepID=A0A914S3U6_PAREQ
MCFSTAHVRIMRREREQNWLPRNTDCNFTAVKNALDMTRVRWCI